MSHNSVNIPTASALTGDAIRHCRKYRYGKEQGGLSKEIYQNIFDTIDHNILLEILGKNIHDGRFVRLVGNMLKAGYIEDWKFNQTISGTPQRGCHQPIVGEYISQ